MIQEQGYVVKTDGQFAWVRTERKSACGHCSSQKGCGTSVFSKLLGNRLIEFRAINSINAETGEIVVLGLKESALLKSAFIMYLLPLIAILVFALAAHFIPGLLGSELSQGWVIFVALSGLGVSYLYQRHFAKQHQTDDEYQPVILRRATMAEQFLLNHTQEV